jgi:hypothetical protein
VLAHWVPPWCPGLVARLHQETPSLRSIVAPSSGPSLMPRLGHLLCQRTPLLCPNMAPSSVHNHVSSMDPITIAELSDCWSNQRAHNKHGQAEKVCLYICFPHSWNIVTLNYVVLRGFAKDIPSLFKLQSDEAILFLEPKDLPRFDFTYVKLHSLMI